MNWHPTTAPNTFHIYAAETYYGPERYNLPLNHPSLTTTDKDPINRAWLNEHLAYEQHWISTSTPLAGISLYSTKRDPNTFHALYTPTLHPEEAIAQTPIFHPLTVTWAKPTNRTKHITLDRKTFTLTLPTNFLHLIETQ